MKIPNFLHKLSHNMLLPYFESYKPFFRKKCYPIVSTSSPFATAINISCLRRIRCHLAVSSYEKYHFCKQQIHYAENH